MHTKNCAHLDFRLDQILVQLGGGEGSEPGENTVWVTDMGLSTPTPAAVGALCDLPLHMGHPAYTAPEALKRPSLCKAPQQVDLRKMDVYSFGACLVGSLLQFPSPGWGFRKELRYYQRQRRTDWQNNFQRLDGDGQARLKLLDIARRAMQSDPSCRPTMAEIATELCTLRGR
ncbi:hypothetical protein WJX73_001507 [Symbiochloris irregularis]|uniref:Protein kinase domain-containing protein n=1 Tax=Symbiochloris irregularis TaxID=706552 RepID=A0AAW1P2M8_9CHLO